MEIIDSATRNSSQKSVGAWFFSSMRHKMSAGVRLVVSSYSLPCREATVDATSGLCKCLESSARGQKVR